MDERYAINCIVDDARLYFRTLGQVENMTYHAGEVEWIAPIPPRTGPSIIFHASLRKESAAERIEALIPGIRAGEIPSSWWITPTSTPENLSDLLAARGFARHKADASETEPGMAMSLRDAPAWPDTPIGITVQTVESLPDFEAWVDVVNEALHGWKMLDAEQYYPLVTRGGITCYLARVDGKPIATSATIQDGNTGSVEFVSALPAHRRQGAGTAVSVAGLRGLRDRGVQTATLRGSPMAKGLYRRLGFQPYFDVEVMPYKGESVG
jgi:ribosomal protein S18 acetylase RimI-like enzyme